MTATSDSTKRIYGGFWIRTAAFLIDLIILTAIVLLVGSMLSITPDLLGIEETGFILEFLIWMPLIFWLVLPWLYCGLWESSKVQATPGKLVFSLVVVDKEGKRLGFLHASGRYWIKAISFVIVHIIYIVVAFTAKKQGLHDLCTNTLVVNKKELRRHEQQLSFL
ncbi:MULTISPECIES: RDD family protein [Paenibacillus]|uniref:RDD family protein n=1 Tax=Paenibacillus peoriae TaxID=59893 RepID=A0A7H0YEE9_9BACL|nr:MULTISPECIES: RDD family protein [Paenibacillus]PNQ81075.1 RDD family protein [Paenibacillus sp. F4]QNR69457.1 RDD family protein [Paenibacillus peoriae]